MINDTQIKNLKPKEKLYRVTDALGLRIEINPNGTKIWRYVFRWEGKYTMLSLGHYPNTSLRKARQLRDDYKQMLQDGIHPKHNNSKNDTKQKQLTFKEVYEIWFDKMKKGNWKPSYALDVEQRTEMYLLPALADKPIDAIDTKMLIDLLLKIDEQGKFDTREKIQSILTRILSHAVGMLITKSNPAREISSDLFSKKEKKNFTHVSTPKDIKSVLSMLEQAIGTTQVTTALNIAPHLFLRPSELAGLRWSEIHWDEKLIRIPAERMKIDNKPHIVPMSNHVVEVLTKLKDSNLDPTLCFPSPLKNSRPISTNSMLQAMRKVGVDKELSTVHGFRHMAVTNLNEKGYNGDAIELQVAHEISGVRGVYNHAKYLEERKPMMEDWSQFLLNLLAE